jgi:hypothetical protein
MADSKNERALDILQRYYTRLMNQMADEIIEKDREFDKGYLAMAEDLIFTYSNKLSCLSVIMSNLGHVSQHDSEPEKPGAGVAEIRCSRDEIAPRMQDWLDVNPRVNIVGFDVLPANPNGKMADEDIAEPAENDDVTCVVLYSHQEDGAG